MNENFTIHFFLRNILEFVFGKRITIKIYDAIKSGKKLFAELDMFQF